MSHPHTMNFYGTPDDVEQQIANDVLRARSHGMMPVSMEQVSPPGAELFTVQVTYDREPVRPLSERINTGALVQLVAGLGLAGVAGLVSLTSYEAAQAADSYVVWYGGVLAGLLWAGRSLVSLFDSR